MAEQDIKENAMGGGTPARLRGLAANGNSISPTLAEVMNTMGMFRERLEIPAGSQVELPFPSGLIIIQDASAQLEKAVAVLQSNNIGTVITPASAVNFFSESTNKICIFNENGDNYIIKNRFSAMQVIKVVFIN